MLRRPGSIGAIVVVVGAVVVGCTGSSASQTSASPAASPGTIASQSGGATASPTATLAPAPTTPGPIAAFTQPPRSAENGLPADFTLDGADPAGDWTSVALGYAPNTVGRWVGQPIKWKGGWVVTAANTDSGESWVELSKDGRTWHSVVAPGDPCPGPGGLFVFDKTGIWRSADGLTWTQWQVPGMPTDTYSPWEAGGQYRCVGGEQGILTEDLRFSRDGIAWSQFTLPEPSGSARTGAFAIDYDGKRFIAVETLTLKGGARSNFAFVSTDGETWIGNQIATPVGLQVMELHSTDHGILAGFGADGGGSSSFWSWSSDGRTWKEKAALTKLANDTALTVESNGDRFLAVSIPREGNWALWNSVDGWSWNKLKGGQLAEEGNLMAFLAPRGIFTDPGEGWCIDFGSEQPGYCATYPPKVNFYGPAK